MLIAGICFVFTITSRGSFTSYISRRELIKIMLADYRNPDLKIKGILGIMLALVQSAAICLIGGMGLWVAIKIYELFQ